MVVVVKILRPSGTFIHDISLFIIRQAVPQRSSKTPALPGETLHDVKMERHTLDGAKHHGLQNWATAHNWVLYGDDAEDDAAPLDIKNASL